MTKMLHKMKSVNGSATIEAVVAFMGFLFTIFTVLNIVNFCRTQALISNAIDTTAKEMSQYGYFYEMSGLQKFNKGVNNVSEVGSSKINEVIGSVDGLYTSLTGTVDGTISRGTEISNAINDKSLNIEQIQGVIDGIAADGSNVQSSINLVSANINNIISNPISYIKCLAAVAANGALNVATSRVIAVPLAKAFFVKHFGDSAEEASRNLANMGVVDGLEGMNFNDSTIFADGCDDIHIVVYYKLQLIQLFKFAESTATIKKEALAGGWLGGDNVIVKVKKEPPKTPTNEENKDNTENPDGAPSETKPETESETETKPEETTTEVPTTKVNTEGSYWHLPDNITGPGQNAKYFAFDRQFLNDTGFEENSNTAIMKGRDSKNNAFGYQYCIDAKHAYLIGSYVSDGWELIKKKEMSDNGETPLYEPNSTKSYTCFVYVPENISDDELAKLESGIDEGFKEEMMVKEEEYGECEIPINIKIVKAGGNYDYGG